MVEVYVIRSLADGTFYTGMAFSATDRLNEHNKGKNKFTKGHLPWELIYFELVANWEDGRKREKYLKSLAGQKWLKKRINTPPFHGGNTGSLPD